MNWIKKSLRKRARIYILPTRMGGYLNGLIFLMFLLSVGYSNNLLLIFTLFLFGFNLLWVIQTHFHLHALKLRSLKVEDGFSGERAMATLMWTKAPELPHRWKFTLHTDNESIELLTSDESEKLTHGQFELRQRGMMNFRHLLVETVMPYGLYKAWIYLPVSARMWVYPARLKDVPSFDQHHSFDEGENASGRKGPHDVWNLSPYQGEESRRISWKHYARTGELVVKEGEDSVKNFVRFVLQKQLPNKELELSRLCTQMAHCASTDTNFVFEIPDKKRFNGTGQKHLTDCLRELAEC